MINKIIVFGSMLIMVLFSKDLSVLDGRQTKITKAIKNISNSVVGINVTQISRNNNLYYNPWNNFFQKNNNYKVQNSGSGVLISSDGYIITNAHVIENAVEIIVILMGGGEYKASIIGADFATDIAVLKIKGLNFEYAQLGNSDDLILGEWVIALGNPLGLFSLSDKATATIGILSGMNMDFGLKESGRVYQNMIQTDAAINSGNSGGPLINILGEVIGINTFIMTGSGYTAGSIGIGFAIPINLVNEIAKELKQHGKVERKFQTGISVQPVDKYIKQYLRLPSNNGVIITDIEKKSEGDKAGLRIGDIILKVESQLVNNRTGILKIISESLKKTGDYITLLIWRDGKQIEMKILLSEGK